MNSKPRLRVLVLAEQCNPNWPSLPIVGYKYALALSKVCDVVVVTQVRNEGAIRERHPVDSDELRFDFIDTEYVARPLHKIASALRGNPEVAWSTGIAMSYPPYLEFERRTWQRYRNELKSWGFDVIHRITPMTPTLPSYMAGRAPQPFVIGPLNGNLDWPSDFAAEQKREKERLRWLRGAAEHLPYARRTWRHADRVLAAFQHTVDDLSSVPADRIVMFPEVGFDESIFYPPPWLSAAQDDAAKPTHARPGGSLTFLFAGRLVPYKLAEVAIRAFVESPTLRSSHRLRVVGDGPERPRLEQMLIEHDAADVVSIEGRQDQDGVADAMRASDVFVFPSIRELGAGVVVEAMACGLLNIVVDYGGPADLIAADRGKKVAMAPLQDLVSAFRAEMEQCAKLAWSNEQLALRRSAVSYAEERFPWHRKADATEKIYRELLAAR